MRKLFTSESVTEGHPDKLCDYISDSVLDEYFAKDPNSRVACETVAGKGQVVVTGEITSNADVDIEAVVRNAIKEVGFDNNETDIDYKTCKVLLNISKQSADIALGVDKSYEDKEGEEVESEGAGDQGLMFGFACDETKELMPMPISLAHKLSKKLTEVRKSGEINYIRPDGKTQVTVEYEDDKPVRIDTIVISTQHNSDVELDTLKKDIKEKVINKVVPKELLDEKGVVHSGIVDRDFFKSLYYRHSHILIEFATEGPGMPYDDVSQLGQQLDLPGFLESRRAEIESNLEPI